uniref:Uncharacterized protein n=1 Tax=Siphoviridae sp. cttFh17 TaxID=2826491 RepID=A0A8S5NI95_9CAUD|nr:MAG TPA: hypothetical protein [Siphoviridae sp. cttFh17]
MFNKIILDYLSRTYSNKCLNYNFIAIFDKNLLTTRYHYVIIKLQTKQQQVFILELLFKKMKKVVDNK